MLAMMQVLLVNEHPLVRDALEGLIRRALPMADLSVAESHGEACSALKRQSADLIIAGFTCRSSDGQKSLSELKGYASTARVVVFGECSSRVGARQAIAAGAQGFIPGTTRPELIAAAIGVVAAGGVYFPQAPPLDDHTQRSDGAKSAETLSRRQLDVVHSLKEGKSNKVIAHELMISVSTVKQHIQALLRISGARNRTEAAALLSHRAPTIPIEPRE